MVKPWCRKAPGGRDTIHIGDDEVVLGLPSDCCKVKMKPRINQPRNVELQKYQNENASKDMEFR